MTPGIYRQYGLIRFANRVTRLPTRQRLSGVRFGKRMFELHLVRRLEVAKLGVCLEPPVVRIGSHSPSSINSTRNVRAVWYDHVPK